MKFFLVLIAIFISGAAHAQAWNLVFSPDGEDIEAILADHSGRVFIGTDTGAFSTIDNGSHWEIDTAGLEAPDEFSFVELRDGALFAGTEITGIFRSSDYGLHWQVLSMGLPDSSFVPAMVCDSSQGLFAALASYGIYYSSDEGNHWESRSTGLPNDEIFSMTISPTGDLYAGLTGFIVRSTNEGVNWTVSDSMPSSNEVLALCADSSGDIFAGLFPGMILRSRDKGTTWDTISPTQAIPAVRCLATTNGTLFVGTYGSGVWKSTDLGDHWSQMSDGLTGENLMVLCCTIEGDSDLFIGTLASDIFRANIASPSSVHYPFLTNGSINFSVEQSPSGVTLRFVLPSEQQVELSVYNIKGRQICDLCNGLFPAGDHAFAFNTRLISDEVCFAVLTTPSGRYVQPFHALQ
jgi:ligand-binding sensor domain-containing protein